MKCNVVRDLLPLYFDGLCSEETSQLLTQHLETCEDCRALKESLEVEQSAQEEQEIFGNTLEQDSIAPLKKVNKKIKSKNRLLIGYCIFIILFIGINSVLLYGQLNKKGISYEFIYDAVRFHFVGKEFAKGNIEPLYELISPAYILRGAESVATHTTYGNDFESYNQDMKQAITDKYEQYFSGKHLKYKGISHIGYDIAGFANWTSTLFIDLNFEGDDGLKYSIVAYKIYDEDEAGGYAVSDIFGGSSVSVYVSNENTDISDEDTEGSDENSLYTIDSIFSCLDKKGIDSNLATLNSLTRSIGQKALEGDTDTYSFQPVSFTLTSWKDIKEGTQVYHDKLVEELNQLGSDYGYYVTGYTWDVPEYDREKFLYRYRFYLEFTEKNSHEKTIVSLDCHRISEQFIYIPKTTKIYGNNLPDKTRKKMERLFE